MNETTVDSVPKMGESVTYMFPNYYHHSYYLIDLILLMVLHCPPIRGYCDGTL